MHLVKGAGIIRYLVGIAFTGGAKGTNSNILFFSKPTVTITDYDECALNLKLNG